MFQIEEHKYSSNGHSNNLVRHLSRLGKVHPSHQTWIFCWSRLDGNNTLKNQIIRPITQKVNKNRNSLKLKCNFVRTVIANSIFTSTSFKEFEIINFQI